jgi:hypothetical protein
MLTLLPAVGVVVTRQGLGALLAEQERLHLEYHESSYQIIATAASPDAQRAYSLVRALLLGLGRPALRPGPSAEHPPLGCC